MLIETGVWILKDAFEKYFSGGRFGVLLLLAVGLLAIQKKKKKEAVFLLLYTLIYAVATLNPLSASILSKLGMDMVYWRIFWFLPIGIFIAYVLVQIVSRWKTPVQRGITAVICCLVLAVSGGWMYGSANFKPAENLYKIPQYVVDVSEFLPDGSRLMGDDYIVTWIRTLNPTITMPYGRQMIWFGGRPEQNELHSMLNQPVLDVEWLAQKAEEYNCDRIVIDKTKELSQPWEDFGMKLIGETIYYQIYERED